MREIGEIPETAEEIDRQLRAAAGHWSPGAATCLALYFAQALLEEKLGRPVQELRLLQVRLREEEAIAMNGAEKVGVSQNEADRRCISLAAVQLLVDGGNSVADARKAVAVATGIPRASLKQWSTQWAKRDVARGPIRPDVRVPLLKPLLQTAAATNGVPIPVALAGILESMPK